MTRDLHRVPDPNGHVRADGGDDDVDYCRYDGEDWPCPYIVEQIQTASDRRAAARLGPTPRRFPTPMMSDSDWERIIAGLRKVGTKTHDRLADTLEGRVQEIRRRWT
jgi:hypothetical protein